MLYSYIKRIIKQFPALWKMVTQFKDFLLRLSRVKDVVIMMVLFHIWPEQTFRFSTRKLLPNKKNRFSKKTKPEIPFNLLESKSSKIKKMKEIDLIGLGKSFNLKNLKKITKPTFLISFFGPVKIDNNGEVFYKNPSLQEYMSDGSAVMEQLFSNKTGGDFIKKNVTYVVGREEPINYFKKDGYSVLTVEVHASGKDGNYYPLSNYWKSASYYSLFNNNDFSHIAVAENVYKPPFVDPYPNWCPTGSFLPAICALSYFAEKINVYGWDFYLNKSPKKMSSFELLNKIYNYKLDTKYSNFLFEAGLLNLYYGLKFSENSKININGFMGDLENHKKLINDIEKVFFK